MKTDFDFESLLIKIQELNELFKYAQRVTPFLEEIFIFIKDLKPILLEFNISVEENLKKMPNASQQLSKVTEATELATSEIMDIADNLTNKSVTLNNNLDNINAIFHELLQNNNGSLNENKIKEFEKFYTHSKSLSSGIKDDSSSIFVSLQVQDVTSQQLAVVNNMIQSMHNKLLHVLNKFNNTTNEIAIEEDLNDTRKTLISKLHRDIAFDNDVINTNVFGENKQFDVDDIIAQHLQGVDITEIFSKTKQNNREEETIIEKAPANPLISSTEDESSQISQDDIDKLFGI